MVLEPTEVHGRCTSALEETRGEARIDNKIIVYSLGVFCAHKHSELELLAAEELLRVKYVERTMVVYTSASGAFHR